MSLWAYLAETSFEQTRSENQTCKHRNKEKSMSINIVDLVKNQLGGSTLGKLSSFLGESSDHTQSAVGAAVPTLLAGLSNAASTPEGAQRLSAAAADHESLADNFGDSIASQGSSLASKGSSALSSLLGGGMLSNLSSVLGRFTGLKGGATSNLLGMVAPLIFGVLGKHARSSGLNASGLASFLGGQKQNIASAMPSGLSSMLGSIPGFSGFAKAAEPEAAYAERGYERTSYEEPRVAKPAHAPTGAGKWALGLVAALVALGLLWTFSHRRGVQRQPATTTISEPAGSAIPATTSVTTGLRDTLTSVSSTLNGITDSDSAEKAIPELNKLNSKLSDIHSSWNALPESAKPTVTSSIQGMSGKINDSIAKLRAMPGVSDKLKPALDELESHMSSFSPPSLSP